MVLGSEIVYPYAALSATSCGEITIPALRARLKNVHGLDCGLEARPQPPLNLHGTERVLCAKFEVGGTNGVAVHQSHT